MLRWADYPAAAWLLAGLALIIAAIGAQPFAGGFNDGSRLATSESLIDRGTLAIDDSVFVNPPADRPPYPTEFPFTRIHGTLDRVRIDGHWYSDKPMVPAILTAGGYRLLMVFGFPRPGDRPDVFCRVATILTSGLGYAVAIGLLWRLGLRMGLDPRWRLVWLVGFALGGVLPAYTRHVNAAMPQLAAVAGLALMLARLAHGTRTWGTLVGVGSWAGFGYTIDGASGPLLLVAAILAVAFRTRRLGRIAVVVLAALPWVATHHVVNFAVGHVWVPLGMVPEYLDWPGSPFDRTNLTGFARHTPSGLVVYVWNLLLGSDGFLLVHLPLVLAIVAGWLAFGKASPLRWELAMLCGWCLTTATVYAILSDNAGGGCLSVRWFVPFLVPGFWLLAQLLVTWPTLRWDFLVLASWGVLVGVMLWPIGPWPVGSVPDVRPFAALAMASWAVVRLSRLRWSM